MTQEEIEIQISKNKEEIIMYLNGNYPLDLVYKIVRLIAEQNELLLDKINKLKNNGN